MAATPISCPRCRASLRSATALALGTAVRCPRCGTPFTVSATTPVTGQRTAVGARKTVKPASVPVARGSSRQEYGARRPLLALVLLGTLLLAGVGAALAVCLAAANQADSQVAGTTILQEAPPLPVPPEKLNAPPAERPPAKPEQPFGTENPRDPPAQPAETPLPEPREEIPHPREAPQVDVSGAGPPVPVAIDDPLPKAPHPLDVPADAPKQPDDAKPSPAKVKPLSRNVLAGLGSLVRQQHADGSWGPGGGFGIMIGVIGGPGPGGMERGDVADTCIAALALLRAGYSPRSGWGANNLRKAVEYVCGQVERSDKESLFVTDVRGTLVQGKIGTHVDTFLAASLLAEAKGKMPDAKSEARLTAALQKIVDKVQRNQKPNGTWQNEGWAPVLSQALASRALNRARQVGIAVEDAVLERTAKFARDNFEKHIKDFKEGGQFGFGAAGVALYAAAAHIGALQDAVQTHRHRGEQARGVLNSPNATERERKDAQVQLQRLDDWEKVLADAVNAIARRLADEQFVRGFGSDGGEEYLSYMMISETLHTRNSKELPRWDKLMNDRLLFAQSSDGAWAGHHCITGRTFCTATALLTLLADRAATAATHAK